MTLFPFNKSCRACRKLCVAEPGFDPLQAQPPHEVAKLRKVRASSTAAAKIKETKKKSKRLFKMMGTIQQQHDELEQKKRALEMEKQQLAALRKEKMLLVKLMQHLVRIGVTERPKPR